MNFHFVLQKDFMRTSGDLSCWVQHCQSGQLNNNDPHSVVLCYFMLYSVTYLLHNFIGDIGGSNSVKHWTKYVKL